MFFKKKPEKKTYDKQNQKPAIKASICNGEMVAGFINHKRQIASACPNQIFFVMMKPTHNKGDFFYG